MKAEELLKKIKRLEDIAICSMFPTVLGTGTSLTKWDEDWFKRTDRYKINLINQFKKEECKKQRAICYQIWHREKFMLKGYSDKYSIENAPEPE